MALSQLSQPKRGYLAQILTVPPLIYPFQYNPTQISDSKKLDWDKRSSVAPQGGLSGRLGGPISVASPGVISRTLDTLGRTFSAADLKSFKAEGDRTINFRFLIDGREQRPGEPARRRSDSGDILGDLAVLRSFVYPEMLDLLDLVSAPFSSDSDRWTKMWFKEPPSAVLVFGGTSIDGYVTELKITETQFNDSLDPVRAEIEMTMIERINSLSFVIDSVKRIGRTFYNTAYEDIGNVLF
jgi:hypothetical protein